MRRLFLEFVINSKITVSLYDQFNILSWTLEFSHDIYFDSFYLTVPILAVILLFSSFDCNRIIWRLVIKIFLIFVLINLLPVNILTVCFQPLAILSVILLSVRSFCNSCRYIVLTVIFWNCQPPVWIDFFVSYIKVNLIKLQFYAMLEGGLWQLLWAELYKWC
jgi:hypothetical protein